MVYKCWTAWLWTWRAGGLNSQCACARAQVVEERVADDDMVMIRGAANTRAATVLLRGANDYMLDEMDRSLHDAFCVVKRVLESGRVVAGALRACSTCVTPACPAGCSHKIYRQTAPKLRLPISVRSGGNAWSHGATPCIPCREAVIMTQHVYTARRCRGMNVSSMGSDTL